MEAVNNNRHSHPNLPFRKVTETFFSKHSPDSAKYMFWKFFQCWAIKDCQIKTEIPDEEVALFFDQLTDLVTAAYLIYQAGDFNLNKPQGDSNV